MKKLITAILSLAMASAFASEKGNNYDNTDFKIKSVAVTHNEDLSLTIWEITVEGKAGKTTPSPNGKLDGATVLGYVFPTTLKPTDVGFSATEGILALALTSHPDFDDTPLWDENADSNFDNDGKVWHPHWVVLTEDKRVDGGLAVKQFEKGDESVTLPPTNPGMPMFMDSPGFHTITNGNKISVVVPDYRMNNKTDFKYDGVAAYMIVNTSDKEKPMLGVYKAYSVASGNLSLPYTVK